METARPRDCQGAPVHATSGFNHVVHSLATGRHRTILQNVSFHESCMWRRPQSGAFVPPYPPSSPRNRQECAAPIVWYQLMILILHQTICPALLISAQWRNPHCTWISQCRL